MYVLCGLWGRVVRVAGWLGAVCAHCADKHEQFVYVELELFC